MTTDEKSENFEIIIPIWNRCKPDHLCNQGVTSNFSFSLVFHSYTSLERQNAILCGNELTGHGKACLC